MTEKRFDIELSETQKEILPLFKIYETKKNRFQFG